jgi:hypothetical protein
MLMFSFAFTCVKFILQTGKGAPETSTLKVKVSWTIENTRNGGLDPTFFRRSCTYRIFCGSKVPSNCTQDIALELPTCFDAAVVGKEAEHAEPNGSEKVSRSQIGPGWMFGLSAKNGT